MNDKLYWYYCTGLVIGVIIGLIFGGIISYMLYN